MEEKYVFEGKTTNEAIEKGLKELKTTKSKVEIKVLEQEDKRSFFSILAPRVVKVEMKLKEQPNEERKNVVKKEINTDEIDYDKAISNLKNFMNKIVEEMPVKNLDVDISKNEEGYIIVNVEGEDTGFLIGYRGEVLNAMQTLLNTIASRDSKTKVRVILDISGYRGKRKKDLENLAQKIASTVERTRKTITLEPMSAYERKIIHTKLQENERVKTHSVGEEPYRKIVVSLNK